MDFIRVAYKENKDGTREFYPALLAIESQDLVIRGGQFAALWDEDQQLYNRRMSHAPNIIDRAFAKMIEGHTREGDVVKKVRNFDNQLFNKFLSLCRNIGDMGPELDQRLVFADQTPTKADAATFKLPYSLSDAPHPAWDELMHTLYDPNERTKIEWAIGSVLTGVAATQIQKLYVLFGKAGTGKSTVIDMIERIFEGHTAAFSAYDLGNQNMTFSLEPFATNPMVAIDPDGDLSKIDTNKNLNAVVGHDKVLINAKGKSLFKIKARSTLFVSSNDPVKINNRKSGLFRRLVDIQPTGRTIEEQRYHELVKQTGYEVGSVARHCIQVFEDLGPTYLSSYRALDMMYRTNDIFNFVEDNRLILMQGVSLKQAHKMYHDWCEQTETRNVYKQFQFRDLLMDYFKEFHQEIMIEGVRHRSYFSGLRELEKFSWKGLAPKPAHKWLELEPTTHSLLDQLLAEQPAQPASEHGTPRRPWSDVTSTLRELNPGEEHFVKVPLQHIIIDFDLKDADGNKSLEACLEAASLWPATYAETSRSGEGLHLHYDFDGDVNRLAGHVSDGIEIKTLLGNASLRRRLSLANSTPVARISSGLPFKEEKVLAPSTMQTEKGLRAQILQGLNKTVHPYTKPSMSFIKMVTDEAFNNGLQYDVSDMYDDILVFAMGSSNQRAACLEILNSLKLKSNEDEEGLDPGADGEQPMAVFDLEVYPNLFAIGWAYENDDAPVVTMLNPTAQQVEELFQLRLVGFNNRGYDNHILWAASMGWSNEDLYRLSQEIITHRNRNAMFGAAYNLAYADIYEFAATPNKKSLKMWEILLGLPHMEMDLPWDQPVPEDRIQDVLDYLANDVKSTRAVLKHLDADFRARQMLAELSGLRVCNTNRQHAEKLIFGDETPDLQYTHLAEEFPGYTFDQFKPGKEKSVYKGINVGEGGYVHAEEGMYEDVALLDVASMHPTSIIELNMFGKHTRNFKELVDIRLAIKAGDLETARQLYGGRLVPYLGDADSSKDLSEALKVVINSVYGFTAATFPNKFRDDRNQDNIVAKRGALFMVDLKEFIESQGFKVVHIKTDSVKIPGATPELIAAVTEFGKKYGYDFEHEATYERFCLFNDAVYVAREDGKWSATGAQFLHPVTFKTLFSKEEIVPYDYVEVKQVAKGAMYLVSEDEGVQQFIGRFAAVIPVLGGRQLIRIDGDKSGAVTGTKGYLWEIDETAFANEMDVDMNYFQSLVDKGREAVEKFGDYANFTRP